MQPVPDPGHHRPGEALLHPLQHRALQLLHLHQQRVLLVVQAGQIVGREVVVELEGRQAWSPAGRIRAAAPRLQSSALAIAQGRCVCIATAPAATSVEARQLHRRKLSWKQEMFTISIYLFQNERAYFPNATSFWYGWYFFCINCVCINFYSFLYLFREFCICCRRIYFFRC